MSCTTDHEALKTERDKLVMRARFRGIQEGPHGDAELELWNCRECGSTIAIELPPLAAADAGFGRANT